MKKYSKNLKRVGLLGCVFTYLFIFLMTTTGTGNAQSAPRGEFIDKHTIKITRGENETLFRDVNPYDDRHGYQGGPRDCRHDFDVENWDRGEVSIQFKTISSTSDCENEGSRVNITLSNGDAKEINAYRLSDNKIFTPVTLNRNDPDCTNLGGQSTGNFINQGNTESGDWKRKPPDERDQQNQYYRDDGDSLYGKMYIKTSAGGNNYDIGTFVITYNDCVGGQNTGDFANNKIWITERAVPAVYDTDGDGTPDPPGGDDGGTGDTTTTECEDQMAEEGGFGWIICPVLAGIDKVSNEMLDVIDNLLALNEEDYNDDEGRLREAWSYFRNIASFSLLIIGLVMVIGQATNKE